MLLRVLPAGEYVLAVERRRYGVAGFDGGGFRRRGIEQPMHVERGGGIDERQCESTDGQCAGDFPDCVRGRQECRSEEHTSELQSLRHLVCRLLLEKKKKQ